MFTDKCRTRLYALVFLLSCCLWAERINAETLFTLEHASGYKIKGIEYRNTHYLPELSITLKKTGVIRKPNKYRFPHIDGDINKLCYGFMITPDKDYHDVEKKLPLTELTSLFKAFGTGMEFSGTKQCNEWGDISCLPYKKFGLTPVENAEGFVEFVVTELDEAFQNAPVGLSDSQWSFIHTKVEPCVFHVHELGNFYFEASVVFIQPSVLVLQGFIDPDQAPTLNPVQGRLYLKINQNNLKPVTVVVWHKDHVVADYEDVGEVVSIKTHFLREYKIAEKYVSLYTGHLEPWDMLAINGYQHNMEHQQVLKYSALTVPDFDKALLKEVIGRMGLKTDFFADSVYPFDFWTLGSL